METHQRWVERPSRAPHRAAARAIRASHTGPGRSTRSPASICDSAWTCTSTPGVPWVWPGRNRSGVVCMSSLGVSEFSVAARVTLPMKAIFPLSRGSGRKETKAAE